MLGNGEFTALREAKPSSSNTEIRNEISYKLFMFDIIVFKINARAAPQHRGYCTGLSYLD
jgi:hypothetical protein